jgi:hypothetical protein
MNKRLIITESEKEQILSLYKPVISEGIKGTSYFTENPQKIYFGSNTSSDYVDIKKGTEFKQAYGGATAYGGSLTFSCKSVGTVKFENGTGNKNYSYKGKTYWANALTKKLNSIFCQTKSNLSTGCVKGDCNNGQGTITGINPDPEGYKFTYTGPFKNGKANGKGKVIWSNGESFAGNFVNGTRSGYGEYIFDDGSVHKGQFLNNKPNGYGVKTFDDGSYYKGNFKDGSKNGYGTYKNIKGIEFSGNWANGNLNGKDISELDELDKPITPPSSNPQTPVGSNPVNNKPQVESPVGDDVNSPQDVKGFQDWLDLNHSGWTTNKTYQTLDKQLSRGYGKYGPLTKAAWASYKDEYLQSKPKPEVESPVNNPPVETPDV